MPDWLTLSHGTFRDVGATSLIELLVSSPGLPLALNPHQGGSALGTNVVRSAGELPAVMMSTFAYGEVVLVEPFVTGREMAVTVTDDRSGPRALPVVEVSFPSDVFDYDTRYTARMTT